MTAAPQCGAPRKPRSRTYEAEIDQNGPQTSKVALSRAAWSPATSPVEPSRARSRSTFTARPRYYYYYFYFSPPLDVVDQLTPTTAMTFAGHVTATVSSSGISGTLAGLVATVQSPIAAVPRLLVSCNGNHSFVLTRR